MQTVLASLCKNQRSLIPSVAQALQLTYEGELHCKEIQPVNPKGNQPWTFIGKTDAEVPILWPPDSKNWLIGKDPDAGKDWKWKEKGMKEDEMVGWHHRLDGHEFEQALGVGDGQESLVCHSPWGQKESDTTEWLNWIIWYTSTHLTAIFFQKGFEAVFSLITKEKFKTWAKKKKTQDEDKVKPRMGLNNSGPKKLSACFVV